MFSALQHLNKPSVCVPARPNDSLFICLTTIAVVAKITLLPGLKLVHALLMCAGSQGTRQGCRNVSLMQTLHGPRQLSASSRH